MRYGGERYYAKVMLGLRSAYYEGATIDYNIELSDDFYDGYELEQRDTGSLALSFVEDKYKDGNHSVNKGLATMHRKGLEKKLELWLDSIVEDCEKICRTCAEEELVCIGIFSNGEAIYDRKTPRNELKAALQEVV